MNCIGNVYLDPAENGINPYTSVSSLLSEWNLSGSNTYNNKTSMSVSSVKINKNYKNKIRHFWPLLIKSIDRPYKPESDALQFYSINKINILKTFFHLVVCPNVFIMMYNVYLNPDAGPNRYFNTVNDDWFVRVSAADHGHGTVIP